MISTGVVILNYNDYGRTIELVRRCALIGQIQYICVVDNHSADSSYTELRSAIQDMQEDSDRLILLKSPENRGYAAGNNLGCRHLIEQCSVDIVFIANPDVEFDADTVEQILDTFQMHPEYAVLGAVMYNMDGSFASRPYIRIPGFWQDLLLCFFLYNRYYEKKYIYSSENYQKVKRAACEKKKEECEEGSALKPSVITVDAIQGSFWAVRGKAFKEAGYLDEGTFLFYEEIIFAMRLRNTNPKYKEGLVISAGYKHNHSATIKNSLSALRTYTLYMQSKLYFNRKYNGATTVKYGLLKAAIGFSILEERLFLMLHR